MDTLFTEGVLPTREGEGGRGEPPEVRGGIGTGVSGATANEPLGFAHPMAIAGPSGMKRKKSTAEAHNNWVKHGWWMSRATKRFRLLKKVPKHSSIVHSRTF